MFRLGSSGYPLYADKINVDVPQFLPCGVTLNNNPTVRGV